MYRLVKPKKMAGGELSGVKKEGREIAWGGTRWEGNCLGGEKTGGEFSGVAI